MLFTKIYELVTVAILQGRIVPLALGFEEKSEGVGANMVTVDNTIVDTCNL